MLLIVTCGRCPNATATLFSRATTRKRLGPKRTKVAWFVPFTRPLPSFMGNALRLTLSVSVLRPLGVAEVFLPTAKSYGPP